MATEFLQLCPEIAWTFIGLNEAALRGLRSSLQPAWLVKLLLSASHLLLHVLPQSTRLRNGICFFTIGRIHVHKMRVLRASPPAKVLDLHDLQGITACQSIFRLICDRRELALSVYVGKHAWTDIACSIESSPPSWGNEHAVNGHGHGKKRNTQQGAIETTLGNGGALARRVP